MAKKVIKNKKSATKKKAEKKILKNTAKKNVAKKVEKKEIKKEKITVFAVSKYIDRSAQKVRLIVNTIRGKKATDAISMLTFSNKVIASPVLKTLKSAVANAKNNFELDENKLKVEKAFVNDAPIYKRGRAGSRGRYQKILRRNCHITIGLKEI